MGKTLWWGLRGWIIAQVEMVVVVKLVGLNSLGVRGESGVWDE